MGGVHIYVHSCKIDHHFIISIVVIIFEVDNIAHQDCWTGGLTEEWHILLGLVILSTNSVWGFTEKRLV